MVKALRVDGGIIDDIFVELMKVVDDSTEGDAVAIIKQLVKEHHERDRIRAQVEKLRDEAKANRSKTFTTTRGDVFKEEAYDKVLALMDGES